MKWGVCLFSKLVRPLVESVVDILSPRLRGRDVELSTLVPAEARGVLGVVERDHALGVEQHVALLRFLPLQPEQPADRRDAACGKFPATRRSGS